MTYRQLVSRHKYLNEMILIIKEKNNNADNTDNQRREYNRITRAYNHKLSTFVGKIIAKRLNYAEITMIDKTI